MRAKLALRQITWALDVSLQERCVGSWNLPDTAPLAFHICSGFILIWWPAQIPLFYWFSHLCWFFALFSTLLASFLLLSVLLPSLMMETSQEAGALLWDGYFPGRVINPSLSAPNPFLFKISIYLLMYLMQLPFQEWRNPDWQKLKIIPKWHISQMLPLEDKLDFACLQIPCGPFHTALPPMFSLLFCL